MPVIQVGISVYKQKSIHVRSCVESCLSQDGVEFVIDLRLDGPDACDEPLKKWLLRKESSHKNLRVHVGDENKGTYASYKWIFSQNKSKYLCQLDADDLLAPGALQQCSLVLEKNQSCGFMYTNCLDIDASLPFRSVRYVRRPQFGNRLRIQSVDSGVMGVNI